MRIVYVSTVGRGVQGEESSKVYKIDLDTGEILASVRLPLAMFDLANPRGGVRGGRGLAFHDGKLYAAIFDGICELNPDDLFIYRCDWFRELKDIHQLYSRFGELYAVNTWKNEWGAVNDGQWDFVQNVSSYHEGVPAPVDLLDMGCRDTLHLNSLCFDARDVYGMLNKVGAIANLSTLTIVMEDELLLGAHDLCLINENEIAVNLSRTCSTVAIDTNTWTVSRELYQAPDGADGQFAKFGWMRGMSYIPKTDTLLLGSAPAQVIELTGVNSGNPVANTVLISDEVTESVFDVVPHPDLM
jgi:hypothetical protein